MVWLNNGSRLVKSKGVLKNISEQDEKREGKDDDTYLVVFADGAKPPKFMAIGVLRLGKYHTC